MDSSNPPLISVIIPCYNHGHYLAEAVESIKSQDYSHAEIIVVDDGSTDNTSEVSKKINVKYIKQENAGLSAARNTGIRHSSGELLVFLDADDWLLPGALKINSEILSQNPELAFTAGAHEKVYTGKGITKDIVKNVAGDCHLRLLEGNFIGMHAAVMYRRWVFDNYSFDTSLNFCEDYDLLLKVSRDYPVTYHTRKIAAYRLHDENMSNNIPIMLETALFVLKRHSKKISAKAEKESLKKGVNFWKSYYSNHLYKGIRSGVFPLTFQNIYTLMKHNPKLGLKVLVKPVKPLIS